MELNIEQFNPTVMELQKIAEEAKLITAESSPEDRKAMRLRLRDCRTAITRKGKEMRDDAIAFQRAVIAKEKELVGIVEPEEDRLKAIEDQIAFAAEMDKRHLDLPRRRQLLKDNAGSTAETDEQILSMDSTEFASYLMAKIQEKTDRDAKVKRDAEAEEKRLKDLAEAEERGKKKAEQDAKDKADREAREKLEREEREHREQERLERDRLYQEWRAGHGWTEETRSEYDERRKPDGTVELWHKIGAFK